MKKQRQEYRIGTGASSILLVLVILCLTVLGILAFSAARADNALSTRAAETADAYYRAAYEAEEKICALSEAIAGQPEDADARLAALLQTIPNGEYKDGTVTFQIAAGDGLALRVTLVLRGGTLARERFAVVNTTEWLPEDNLNLFH